MLLPATVDRNVPKAPEFQGNCHCWHPRSSDKFHGKEDLFFTRKITTCMVLVRSFFNLFSSERMLLSRRSLISTSADFRRSNSRQAMKHFLCAALCSCIGILSNSFLHLFSVHHPPGDANVDWAECSMVWENNLHGRQNNAFLVGLKTSDLLGVSSPFSFFAFWTNLGNTWDQYHKEIPSGVVDVLV